MTKTTYALTIFSALMLGACNTNQTSGNTNQEINADATIPSETDIPFTEAKNYFVKNTYKDGDLSGSKITSQSDFEKIFGMATTMAENEKPTPIDFSKQYAIVYIAETTDKAAILAVNSLKKSGNVITLTYDQTEGEKQSFTIRPFILVIVDNQYQGELKLQKK